MAGVTITVGSEELFNDAITRWVDVCLISANKVAAVYQDDADANDIGEAVVGDTPISGWAAGNVDGVPAASIAAIDGIPVANIAKIDGI